MKYPVRSLSCLALSFLVSFEAWSHQPLCGNGTIDVRNEEPNCPYKLYGATNNTDGASQLYSLDEKTGKGSLIGNVTTPNNKLVKRLSALDFSSEGILYGIGDIYDPTEPIDHRSIYLLSIDCLTGDATPIAQIDPDQEKLSVSDMSFYTPGAILAHIDPANSTDQLSVVFPQFSLAGQTINIGETGADNDLGNALSFGDLSSPILYHADDKNLYTINIFSSAYASVVSALHFFDPENSPYINAMDYDPATGIMYVSVANGASQNFLATLNLETGVVSYFDLIPDQAPAGLEAIAVNVLTEECDAGGEGYPEETDLPALPGTGCSDNCTFIETNCDNNLDDDYDGYTDLYDTDCQFCEG